MSLVPLNRILKTFAVIADINNLTTARTGPLSLQNGYYTNKDIIMAVILKEYFASVFTVKDTNGIEEASPDLRGIIPLGNIASLKNCDFPCDITIRKRGNIKVAKTSGPDNIVPQILKEAKDDIYKHLATIFQ